MALAYSAADLDSGPRLNISLSLCFSRKKMKDLICSVTLGLRHLETSVEKKTFALLKAEMHFGPYISSAFFFYMYIYFVKYVFFMT